MSILWNPTEATVVEKVSLPVITTGAQNMGNGVYWLKAGTPLDEDLAVANDGDAMYIVAEDFFFISTNPNQDRMVPLIKAGYVDLNKAEAAAGITYTDAAVAALKEAGIEVVDGLLETGGGSGGGVVTAKVTSSGGKYAADVSYADMRAAYEAGSVVQMELSGFNYRLLEVTSSALIFSYENVVQNMYVHQQLLGYTSNGISLTAHQMDYVASYVVYAVEDSGSYVLGVDAATLSGYVSYPSSVVIQYTDSNEVNHYCPVIGVRETPADDDFSYAFYIVLNGSIAAFTAASGYINPTYTP